MRRAREFRDLAWNTLRGRYWWAVLAALIAGPLGGYAAQSPVTLNLNADDIQGAYNFVQSYTSTAAATITNILSSSKSGASHFRNYPFLASPMR